MTKPSPSPEVSVKEVALELGKSYVTVLNYIKTGKMRAVRRGGQWVILRTELERFRREGNLEESNLRELTGDDGDNL